MGKSMLVLLANSDNFESYEVPNFSSTLFPIIDYLMMFTIYDGLDQPIELKM